MFGYSWHMALYSSKSINLHIFIAGDGGMRTQRGHLNTSEKVIPPSLNSAHLFSKTYPFLSKSNLAKVSATILLM